jgi:hypothetical protein
LSKSIKNAFDIAQNVVVPESNDVISRFLQSLGSDGVFRTVLGMLSAVDLDDQFQIERDEINNVAGDRLLPFEFDAFEALERFQAKWTPVRVKKTRQNKRLEPRFDSIGTQKALVAQFAPDQLFGFRHPASERARLPIHVEAPSPNPLPNGERASEPFPSPTLV